MLHKPVHELKFRGRKQPVLDYLESGDEFNTCYFRHPISSVVYCASDTIDWHMAILSEKTRYGALLELVEATNETKALVDALNAVIAENNSMPLTETKALVAALTQAVVEVEASNEKIV